MLYEFKGMTLMNSSAVRDEIREASRDAAHRIDEFIDGGKKYRAL